MEKPVLPAPPPFPLKPIVAAGISILTLGCGWLASPHLGVICELTSNCSSWEQDLTKAQKMAFDSKTVAEKKDSSKDELDSARSKISQAITLLNPLNQKSSLKPKVSKVLADAQSTQTRLNEKIAKLNPTSKPPTDKEKPKELTKLTGANPPNPEPTQTQEPPEVYNAPEPVVEAPYEPPAPRYESPAPRYESPAPEPERYYPPEPAPAPQYAPPADPPASSPPPRDEQIIPN